MKPYLFRIPEWVGQIPEWIPGLGGTQVGGRPIFSYGVMLGISFLVCAILGLRLSTRLGADKTKTPGLMLWAAVGAILGARILYFVASAPESFTLARFFRFQDGGLVAYGGYIGGTSHSVMPETPLDNVIAMYEAFLEYQVTSSANAGHATN